MRRRLSGPWAGNVPRMGKSTKRVPWVLVAFLLGGLAGCSGGDSSDYTSDEELARYARQMCDVNKAEYKQRGSDEIAKVGNRYYSRECMDNILG